MELNIIELIESNPITKLSSHYNSKLINRVVNSFTGYDQQLFIASFYCSLNYDQKMDFVIDLDDVWKWLGFNKKYNSLYLLEKHFNLDIDYIIYLPSDQEQKKKGSGGHNIKKIMLTVKTFKTLCLKAGTKKADEIHDYYLKMEEIIQEVINEESNEMKLQLEETSKQLQDKNKELEEQQIKSQKEKDLLREKTLLEQFARNSQCVYYGLIDDKSISNERLIKFGNSNHLQSRVETHKKTYTNFRLMNVFKVSNQIQIENAIKQHSILKNKRRNIIIDNVNYTELLAINDFTLEEIDEMIKNIIKENEYNMENYLKVIEKNKELESIINNLEDENKKLLDKNNELETKLGEVSPIVFYNENKSKSICKMTCLVNGYLLYAFEHKKYRYKCGVCRIGDLESVTNIFKNIEPTGKMIYTKTIHYPFLDRIMNFLLKERLTKLGNDMYDGDLNDIKIIFEIVFKIEEILIGKGYSLKDILDKLNHQNITSIVNEIENPEVPVVRKAKRAIDQINKDTGEVIASYPSIEEAGRKLGLTTGTAIGIALRNKTVCKGFLWRYANISQDDQYSDQPVIKVCCSTGDKIYFKNMADAARDINISAPGLRNRILTKVHVNDYHWVFDKGSTHYT